MKKMAHFADLHFGATPSLPVVSESWKQAVDYCIENKIDLTIIAGDIFHTETMGGTTASTGDVYKAFAGPLTKLAAVMPVIIVRGNHEMSSGLKRSALATLEYTGAQIVESAKTIEIDNLLICCLPWTNKSKFVASQKVVPTKQINKRFADSVGVIMRGFKTAIENHKGQTIFVSHCEINGVEANAHYRLVGGDFGLTRNQVMSLDVDVVALGHIHKRSEEPWMKMPWYCGALVQNDFGERGNAHGFSVFKVGVGKTTCEFVDVPCPEFFKYNNPGMDVMKKHKDDKINKFWFVFDKRPEEKILNYFAKRNNFRIDIMPQDRERRSLVNTEHSQDPLKLVLDAIDGDAEKKAYQEEIEKIAKQILEKAVY